MTIDWWTLALQTINFLVLVWILARFFFRPLSAVIARRQASTAKALADVEAIRSEAEKAKSDAEKARSEIAAEHDRLLAAARADADKERARLIAVANEQARTVGVDAAAAIDRERAAMEAALVDRIRSLAIEIARRLLERLSPTAALDAFVRKLCEQVPALKPETRAAFVGESEGAIEVVTPRALSADETSRVRAELEKAFGVPLTLSFRADPAVIAGVELMSHHAFIRSSWREDLDQIVKALRIDGKNAG